MKQRRRIYYSESQKALMWERWRAGESLQHIAQLFDRNHSSVAGILAQTGGIQPPPRRRSKRSLTLAEREEISRGLAADDSIQSIARRLSRAPSTICREIKRNSGEKGYRADFGDELAWQRALRPKACNLVATPALAKIVAAKLQLEWSPQQVAGWLKRTWPGNEGFHVSHETIYRTLFIQARGALKKELLEHLRRTRAMRRSLIKRRRPRVMVVSAMLFRSVNVPLRLRTAPFRGTGKATSCAAAVTARLQRL